MTGRKQYYKLDEIGIVGTQKKESSFKKKQTAKKTGEIFRAARKSTGNRGVRKAS